MQRFAVNARWYPMYWLLLICACGGGKAAWPSMSVNVDYGGCEDKAAAACMCVGGVCHSTGDAASRSLMIHLGLLVYRFTTRYNLSMYSRFVTLCHCVACGMTSGAGRYRGMETPVKAVCLGLLSLMTARCHPALRTLFRMILMLVLCI